MPYKRKYVGKRRPSARSRPRTTNYGASFLNTLKGYALLKLKQKLGLNPESKFVDVAGTTTATGSLVLRIASPTIAQGDGVGSRSGASLRISKVETRIGITAVAAATAGCNVRIIQVRHLKDGTPSTSAILEDPNDFASPISNHVTEQGVVILRDEVVSLGTAAGGPSAVSTQWTHTGLADHMTWPDSDTTGLPSALTKGMIATYWMVDNLTTAPYFIAKSRYWFVDN